MFSQQKSVLLLGLLFSITILSVGGHLAWQELLNKANKGYAVNIIHGLYDLVDQVDHLVGSGIKGGRDSTEIERGLKQIKGLENAVLAISNDRPSQDLAWYLASRSHTDWVLLHSLETETSQSDAPAQWGWTLVRHAPEEKGGGLWIKIFIPHEKKKNLEQDFNEYHDNILNFSFTERLPYFYYFEMFFKTLLFPQRQLAQRTEINTNILCHENSEYELLSPLYRAFVSCQINGETVHFNFSKKYDTRWHQFLLLAIGALLLFLTYLFLRHIQMLQTQGINHRLEVEKAKTANLIGSKLIHDLKKGIMTPLNQLSQIYENDLDTEVLQPDFKGRLQHNLNKHFQYLHLLNKYVQLLTNNLKRVRERRWVLLEQKIIIQFSDWILGKYTLSPLSRVVQGLLVKIEIEYQDSGIQVGLFMAPDFPRAFIPEISFYRILKNIWENYNAYGCEKLVISLTKQDFEFTLTATNRIKEQTDHTASSTNLGFIIIRQLLEDNFGADRIKVLVKKADENYLIQINFPVIEVSPE